MKGNKVKTNLIITIAVGVVAALIVGFLCFDFFSQKEETPKKEKKDIISYVVDQDKVKIVGGNTDFVTNEKCNTSNVKKKFSLKIDNGSIQVNNLDTMENFLMEKIVNVSTMVEFNYEKTCDTAMYAVLTNDGLVFYTYDDVTKATDIRKIENKFTLLKSELRFTEIFLGEQEGVTDLYGKTAAGYLYKISLR